MKKIINEIRQMIMKKKTVSFIVAVMLLLLSAVLYPVQMDESLVDDAVALITNAKKIAHTTFLLDTSESMNTFAFSDYINTCADSKANIDNAIVLCNNAYNQCRNVESNAMCDVDLGCGDILAKCQELQVTKTRLYTFCANVESVYTEPGKTQVVADPTGGGSNDAKKYVGPWDPRRADYKLDLCFYNWTEDTGGQVLSDQTSGHWTNPNNGSGYTDRRDWDCLTDGVQQPEFRGGLWLNWKYSTSLDAIKIILADTHDFSYPPRQRGERKCQLTTYFPYKDDPVLGRVCYQEFETNPTGPTAVLELAQIADRVRANWTRAVDDNGGAYYPDANCLAAPFTILKDTVLPVDPSSVASGTVPCDVCFDVDGIEVPCRQYAVAASGTNTKNVNGITAEIDYTCCINYECSDPKCRDDDETCRASGDPCILGYYSDFDQDQNHCCDMLGCVEADPSGCATGGRYLPGPGNDAYSDPEANITSLGMPSISAPDEFQDVTLTAKTVSLSFGAVPANVDKVIVSVYYGCDVAGEIPSTKIGEKTYTAPVVAPGSNIFAAPMDLSGCETSGYAVNVIMQIFHSGANFSAADVSLDVEFSVNYTSGSDADINVLDNTLEYYSEYISEATGAPSERVNEYECKTTFYHKQTYVQSGGSGNCNWTKITPKPSRCVEPDHTAIAKDQWGSVTKTACSWLCRDDVVYDDVWKCRAFFTQMDNPLRGGAGVCMGVCPGDNPATLEACCLCLNANSHLYKDLETPEYVKFSAAGANLNCSVSGYEEGVTSEGKRTYTSAYMAEVITGHIKELGDSSYRLNPAGYVSPYNLPTNKWYSSLTLLNRSGSFLKDSFLSVFETGKNDTRDIACVYDLMDNFEGEDCMDDCGTGCCSISIGGRTDYCDYPNFWMKIPNTEGGNLILPATNISGAGVPIFQNIIKGLKARGGSTLGETLYDVWRYLGGMKPAHDLGYANYASPYEGTDPMCFINDAIIISGGQPQFDDNYSIRTKTTQGLPTPVPYAVPDALDIATPVRPYVRENWYLTSFLNVANFVTTRDFFHANSNCRVDNNVNIYGYEVGGTASTGDLCTKATDYFDYPVNSLPTGNNYIDTIHTVAIGEWTLAPMFNNPSVPEYLDSSVLRTAAVNSGGKYFSLTASGADGTETFFDLTSMFNAFAQSGSGEDRASGRPHWTSALVQTFESEMKVRDGFMYSPAIVPIDNKVSRFWFGNLKQYTIDDASSGCDMGIAVSCVEWDKRSIPMTDCFYPSDNGSDMADSRFGIIVGGGVARKLAEKVAGTAAPCDNIVGSNSACFTSGARKILYDNGTDMLELKNANPAWFTARFQLTVPTITQGEVISILDYIYGYDAYDEYPPVGKNHMRFSQTPLITVDDPFSMSFDGSSTTTVRPLIMGGIFHSKPIAINYEDEDTTRIFVGANDGMLHSFDQDGNEVFGYIPNLAIPALAGIMVGTEGLLFKATVDGPITLFHMDQSNDGIINEDEKAYLIFGYRRGAKGYTVIDISELDNPKFVQHINTEGYSFGGVSVFRKCDGVCKYAEDLTYYLAVPGGYDPCHDSSAPACPINVSGHLDPMGNEIYLYKFNKTTGAFDFLKEYDMYTPTNDPLVRDAGWMRTSFAATPVPINTKGKLTVDTEFVYFYDISSTVFRVDMQGKNDPAEWEFKAVFAQRAVPQPITWGSGIRTYYSPNVYPPLSQFSGYGVGDNIMPIPIATGNAAQTRAAEIDEMIVMYDKWDSDYSSSVLDSNNFKDVLTDQTGNGGNPWPGPNVDIWKYSFIEVDITEKAITSPLIYHYNMDGSNSTVLWNTYIPAAFDECRNWGNSYNFEKQLVDGKNFIDRWSNVRCGTDTDPISLATSVGVVKSQEKMYQTFGSGHDIFTKAVPQLEVGPAEIIKWYELY